MKLPIAMLALACAAFVLTADDATMAGRRQRAAAEFHDGILLLHAKSALEFTADGFRQDPYFYYFTGLEDTLGAILAVEGKSGESWLFVPPNPPFAKMGLEPEALPGPEAAKRLGMAHVADWKELDAFLAQRADSPTPIYYTADPWAFAELPPNLRAANGRSAPAWLAVILAKYPHFEGKEVSDRAAALMAVADAEGMASLRTAAKASVAALEAGMRAIRPGVSQRSVEAVVVNTCWTAGARGVSFWPWAMAGSNGMIEHTFTSLARYDHLNATMQPGDLVRLDLGCEWNHYQGDLGRTVPVSGHFSSDQRETWNLFVDAYRAGVAALREGVTVDQVFASWRTELLRHANIATSPLAKRAIALWSTQENVPFWQVHLTNLVFGRPSGPLAAGTVINFEPIAAIDGQGYFLEDMFAITKEGAELLTPGLPYTAEEIEKAMH